MSKTFIKPHHLKEGDKVAIVSPSSTIEPFPKRTARAVSNMKKIGLEVIFSPNAKKSFGHNGGTPEERAADINGMFADPSVKAIICSTGGLNANAVLPLLDYEIIRNNPKVFCGYSDITVLNNAILAKSGMVTFNGPTLLPSFGGYDGIHNYTESFFKKAAFSNVPIGEIDSALEYSDETLWWEKEDTRSLKFTDAMPMYTLHEGVANGWLFGGNLDSFCFLGGTEYLPNITDSILFLEDEGESVASIERRMCYLDQIGVLKKIKGLLFARPYQFVTETTDRTLDDVLFFYGKKYNFPVVCNLDFGHTTPMFTIPLGVNVSIVATGSHVEVSITETATT